MDSQNSSVPPFPAAARSDACHKRQNGALEAELALQAAGQRGGVDSGLPPQGVTQLLGSFRRLRHLSNMAIVGA